MKYVIKDVWALDCKSDAAMRCDVTFEDGKIKSIDAPGEGSGIAVFDGKGSTALIPGFVNAHGHASMTLLRGVGEELPLLDWLAEINPKEDAMDAACIYAGAALAALEMISTGTTCFTDMYMYMDEVARAAQDMNMKACLGRGIIGEGEAYDVRLQDGLALAKKYEGSKSIKINLAPHAPYTVPHAQMCKLAQTAIENNLPVQLHFLETQWEVEYFKGKLKIDPIEYLQDTGLFDVPHLILAHGVWIQQEHFDALARPNVTIAHCPASNLKLGSGIAPVAALLASGVRVALGTDGAASNDKLDMWDEMRLASLLQKGVNNDPTLLTARQVFEMATLTGATALGFGDTGLIKEGYALDATLVDLSGPNYVGWKPENLLQYLVYAGSSSDISAVFIDGKKLYEGGKWLECDAKEIMRGAKAARDVTKT